MLAMQKGDRTGSRASPGLWPHRVSLSLLGFLHKMKLKCPPPRKKKKSLKEEFNKNQSLYFSCFHFSQTSF